MRADMDVADARALMSARMRRMRWLPRGTKVTPMDAPGVHGEWVEPRVMVPGRTILYVHGGAFMMCSPETHRALVARIAAASRARVFAVRYRLAPEHPFPAALDDVRAAWRWMLAQGVSPMTSAFGGDSAGGGLALALLLALRDAGEPLPRCAFALSPWTDLTNAVPSRASNDESDAMLRRDACEPVAAQYVGGADARDPYLSPLFGRFDGLPPLLLHVSDSEMLLDDSRLLAEKARAAGVRVQLDVWHQLQHVWHFMAPIVPEARRAIAHIGEYLDRELRVG
jgi:acetyl esterase/lipase